LKILVTLDGSGLAAEVLPIVVSLAKDAHASIILVTIAKPDGGSYRRGEAGAASGLVYVAGREVQAIETGEQALESITTAAAEYLEDIALPIRSQGIAVESQVVVADDVVAAILRVAREQKADLIAMATHGRTGLRATVQGSIANEVMRVGAFPILLTRPQSG
jgi:nucleotide-binding universal stress UspA family protein